MKSSPLDSFADEARAFCHWATGDSGEAMSVASALRRVSTLYDAALELPHPFSDDASEDSVEVEPPHGSVARVKARARMLPLDVYWKVFDPIGDPPDAPVAGSIVDDLEDIHRCVASGLVLFDLGEHAEARWEWGFNFRVHWGEHATSAMVAMHAYLAREDPDGLSPRS